ncbi:MAG TPA: N-acetylmuramoyl-L-alanine amidase, partial [Acidimicrobiia bacterium]
GPDAVTPSSTTTTRASSTTTTTSRPKPMVSQPNIITRAEWGADESIRKDDQKYAPINKLFVHHTVTSPDGQDSDPAATVRAIYAYHVQGNGWDDIGYNFLIDGEGRVYEGRWAREYAAGEEPTGEDLNDNGVVGAHVLNHNAGSAGVAMLGDFTNGEPTEDAREALIKFMAWKANRHGIDVLAKDPFTSSDGIVSTFPNLAGHRDAGQTACPGSQLYPLLPDIREEVAQYVTAVTGSTSGYWTATADGRVLPFGNAPALGSMAGTTLSGAIVGMAPTMSGKGYWLLGSDGGVFSFGDAKFYGSTGDIKLNKPVVRMAPTPTGKGYWFVASDGGIFSFGDAKFYGSTGSIKLNKPVVGMAATPTGKGYWLVASDGGIFAFGDAKFHGSTGALTLNKPVVSMAPNPTGSGYWLVASDGGLFAFGVPYFGSVAAAKPEKYSGAVQMRATRTGKGYYIADANGGIAIFGDARFLGADTSQRPPGAAVDLVLAP